MEPWRGPISPTDVHPLPARKRRLTLPNGTEKPTLEADQNVTSQQDSLLFAKLPLELRRQIWKEVVGGFDIYMGIVEKQLKHYKIFDRQENGDFTGKIDRDKLLPILLTCRQV